MTRYILAAATHEEYSRELMNEQSEELFRRHITPLLTNNSLLILEGNNVDEIVRWGHPDYHEAAWDVMQVLGNARPSLAGIDPRFVNGDLSGVAFVDTWLSAASIAEVSDNWRLPSATFSELMNYLRTSPVHPRMSLSITGEVVRAAQWVNTMSRKFDRTHIEFMRSRGRKYDVCVLVAGAAHCMSIALKTDYEIICLRDHGDESDLLHDYLAYLANCVWPGMALQQGAAA